MLKTIKNYLKFKIYRRIQTNITFNETDTKDKQNDRILFSHRRIMFKIHHDFKYIDSAYCKPKFYVNNCSITYN